MYDLLYLLFVVSILFGILMVLMIHVQVNLTLLKNLRFWISGGNKVFFWYSLYILARSILVLHPFLTLFVWLWVLCILCFYVLKNFLNSVLNIDMLIIIDTVADWKLLLILLLRGLKKPISNFFFRLGIFLKINFSHNFIFLVILMSFVFIWRT